MVVVGVSKKDLRDPLLFQVGFLNTKPHPKQIDILRSKAKHKVICCGRRAGKTRLVAGEAIRGALFNEYPRQLFIAPVYRQLRPGFNQIVKYIEENKLMRDVKKVIGSSPQKIIFVNKAVIDFGSGDNPSTLRGEAYDRIFKDEAGFFKEEIDNVIRPMMFDTDADIWETSTPWKKNQFYYNYMKGLKGDPKIQSFHFTSLDNPYINTKRVQEEIDEWGEDSFYVQAEIYGNFINDVDSYFKQSLIDSCIDEDYGMVSEEKLIGGSFG